MELSLAHMMKTSEDERVGLQHAWHMGKMEDEKAQVVWNNDFKHNENQTNSKNNLKRQNQRSFTEWVPIQRFQKVPARLEAHWKCMSLADGWTLGSWPRALLPPARESPAWESGGCSLRCCWGWASVYELLLSPGTSPASPAWSLGPSWP